MVDLKKGHKRYEKYCVEIRLESLPLKLCVNSRMVIHNFFYEKQHFHGEIKLFLVLTSNAYDVQVSLECRPLPQRLDGLLVSRFILSQLQN